MAAREVAETRRRESQRQLERRQASYEFLSGLLSLNSEQSDPDLKLRDLLESASSRLETQHLDDPELRAELYEAIGGSYHNLGLRRSAVEALERAWRLRKEAFGDGDPRTRSSLRGFAMASGRVAELYGIERLAEDAENARAAGAHDDWLWNLQQIAVQHLLAGRWEAALGACDAILLDALAIRDAPRLRARVLRDRGHALAGLARREEAAAEMERAERLFAAEGAPEEAEEARVARAIVFIQLDRKLEAVELLEPSHAYRFEVLGPHSASTAHVAVNLANASADLDPARARELCEQVLAHTSQIGRDHRLARAAQRKLAELHFSWFEDPDRALELLQELQCREQAIVPVPRRDCGLTSHLLALLHAQSGRLDQALAEYRLADEHFAHVQRESDPNRRRLRAGLLACRLELEGAPALDEQLDPARADWAAATGALERAYVSAALGALLAELGEDAEARNVLAGLPAAAATHRITLHPSALRALERLGIR